MNKNSPSIKIYAAIVNIENRSHHKTTKKKKNDVIADDSDANICLVWCIVILFPVGCGVESGDRQSRLAYLSGGRRRRAIVTKPRRSASAGMRTQPARAAGGK